MTVSRATALEVEAFFYALHNLGAKERIEIRWKPSGSNGMKAEFYSDVSYAAAKSLSLASAGDVYFGVATRNGENGTRNGVSQVGALWADIDFKSGLTEVAAKETIMSLDHRPSFVIGSGKGLHLYWLLRDPARKSEEIGLAEETMRLLASGLGGDAVYDCSRILRVPGTFNYKGDVARSVIFKRFKPEERYELNDLHRMAESLSDNSDSSTKSGGKVARDVLARPVTESGRNVAMTSIVGSLRWRGLQKEAVQVVLKEVNRLCCSPPLGDRELDGIVDSVCDRYERGEPFYPRSRARRVYNIYNKGEKE